MDGILFSGPYGTMQECPNEMVGFQVQICNEGISASNMRMFCTRDQTSVLQAGTFNAEAHQGPCNWGPPKYCPDKFAVCGFQNEQQPRQGGGDDNGITNVRVLCCFVG